MESFKIHSKSSNFSRSQMNTPNSLRFIDLFSGLGGFRIALEELGCKCVYSSEINLNACEIYQSNFQENPYGDIREIVPEEIPDFEILCAGFPCQSFSVSGRQKGFYDVRGTLFFDICNILEKKHPRILILENVANLTKHDKGKTLNVILDSLVKLGYYVSYDILNAKDFGLPQNRERIFIVGMLDHQFDFSKVQKNSKLVSLKEFLKETNFKKLDKEEYVLLNHFKKQKSGLIFVGYRKKRIRIKGVREGTNHLSRVHKQSNRIYHSDGVSPTISSQEKSGRYWILHNNEVKKLSINEIFSIFGFPESYKKLGSVSSLYERIGNSVCIPVIKEIGMAIIKQINQNSELDHPVSVLEKYYLKALGLGSKWENYASCLSSEEKEYINIIVNNEETSKGVYTVTITSLLKKILDPKQDIRLHRIEFSGGYSGRTFDTCYVTPWLKSKNFKGAMKESGWLTRSLEQPYIYDLNYQGKINGKDIKTSFLYLLDSIEKESYKASFFLVGIFAESIIRKTQSEVELISPIERESKLTIYEVLSLIEKHFYFPYKKRGRSILPIIAIYSIYECVLSELSRFKGASLRPLESHYNSDKNSKQLGDITVIRYGKVFEVLEIKSNIVINEQIIWDVFRKIKFSEVPRYYILSTLSKENSLEVKDLIEKIKKEHGCQVIINGVFDTLKYYLRLLENSDLFLENYIKNLILHKEIPIEYKIAWNQLTSSL